MSDTFVVIGGGLAAANALEQLRADGFEGRLVLYAEEPHLPYERPPLSKGVLLGNDDPSSVFPHPAEWYDEQQIELHTGTAVDRIDRSERRVLAGDSEIGYDKLLVVTGASPRRLAMADEGGPAVHYLRTIEESAALKAGFASGRKVVIIGAGWIGLETASAARQAGAEVTVVETLALPLLRVLGREVATLFASLHREHGVELQLGATIAGISRSGEQAIVHLADGTQLQADLVVVGVGVYPNTALAEKAGMAVDNGVVVSERLVSDDPDIFAAGDVANAWHPKLGHRIRVEHWDTAIEQGKIAGHNMLGAGLVYDRLPYFFTDQYDLGMEYVGNVGPDGYSQVIIRGDRTERVFTAFWLRGSTVLAGMQANDWDAMDGVRELVGRDVDPARLADEAITLDDVLVDPA
ncbi:MAG: NAD(P)/FAD-dependent oxidoreductase [Nocardioidaceae bacterium]